MADSCHHYFNSCSTTGRLLLLPACSVYLHIILMPHNSLWTDWVKDGAGKRDRRLDPFLNKLIFALFCLVVGAVTGLRYHAALQRGAYYFDESYYLLEARGLRHALAAIPGIIGGRQSIEDVKKEMRDQGDMFPPSTAKPTFALLLMLSSYLPLALPVSGNVLSLLAATATGWLLWRCFKRWRLPTVPSLLVVALWETSPVVGYYAVSSLAQCVAAFFFTAGVLRIIEERYREGGLWVGLAVTCHYGITVSGGLLLLFTAVHVQQLSMPRSVQRPAAIGLLCFAFLPALFWESVYHLGLLLCGSHFSDMHFWTYSQQFKRQLVANAQGAWTPAIIRRNGYFFVMIAREQGLLLSTVIIASMLRLITRYRHLPISVRILLLTTGGLFIFWLCNSGVMVSRVSIFFMPLLFLLLGCALGESYEQWFSGIRVGAVLVGISLIAGTFMRSKSIAERLQNPYVLASNYLTHLSDQGIIVDLENTLTWQLYTGRRMTFHQEEVRHFSELMPRLQQLVGDARLGRRVAFMTIGQHLPFTIQRDSGAGQFFGRVFARGPARSWDAPYTGLALFHYDDVPFGNGSLIQEESLNLYWINATDVQSL